MRLRVLARRKSEQNAAVLDPWGIVARGARRRVPDPASLEAESRPVSAAGPSFPLNATLPPSDRKDTRAAEAPECRKTLERASWTTR